MLIVYDKIYYKNFRAVRCYNYNTCMLFAWWLNLKFGLSLGVIL